MTLRVNPVRVTVEELRLVKTICWTVTLVAPESWLELPGGLLPWEAETVTAVGVGVGVKEGLKVPVGLGV